MNYERKVKILSITSIVLYVLFLIWALYFKFGVIEEVRHCASHLSLLTDKERFLFDIIPFDFSNTHQKLEHFLINILNLIIFLPLGVALPLVNKKIKIVPQMLFCFIISLIIEVTQYFTLIGGFASDDLLMNTLGYFLGLAFYCLTLKKFPSKVNYYILLISNVILSIVLIYAFIDIIPIFNEYIDVIKEFA